MADRPNILFITSDQQHFSTLGVVNPKIKTPNLDRLCREGTRFDRAYCNNPLCSPSRSTMITGMYPSWHGCWTIGVKLDESIPTIGDHLRNAGYLTQLIGKAHFQPLKSVPEQTSIECQPKLRDLGFWRHFAGPWYGFDRIELARNHTDEAHCGQHYAIWMEQKGLANWRDYFDEPTAEGYGSGKTQKHHWTLPEEYHYTTWTGERTCANIEEAVKKDRPFFTWASFHDPHPSYLVSEPWASMYDPADMEPGELDPDEVQFWPPHFKATQEDKPDFSSWKDEGGFANHGFSRHKQDRERLQKDMAIYYGMVSFMDKEIGRILDKLDELGVADNTIVVFTTDHGHFIGHHGLTAKGAFHFEDLIRLPFIVRWPGKVPAGKVSEALQALIDLPETFLEAAGEKVPGEMQGVSQLPVWTGQSDHARDWVICENRHQPTKFSARTFVTPRFKLTVYRDRDFGELFDLEKDPGERRNRWDDPEYKDVKFELFRQFLNADIQREPTRYERIAHA